ncbi:MAG: hypothetical protein NUV84_02865 [Candidatus Uhrbacteria bacterium]|nr:hypothetical protein [Candidatus Uhrbacteria bacterium]
MNLPSRPLLFSLDAEVDGLYGDSFAIAAVLVDGETGEEVARFEGRLPDSVVTNDWVKQNVLPALADWEPTHASSEELEEAFWTFYVQHCLEQGQWGMSPRKNVAVIAMFGSPVESGLFRRCVERDPSRNFQGPYPLHEVGTLLTALGEEHPDSSEAYLSRYGLTHGYDGVAHHPTYDAVTAAQVWRHAMARLQ